MIKDIIKITIFEDRVDFEHIGEHEVSSWSDQVLIGHEWKTFSDGYVPNEPEEIRKYLRQQKRRLQEEIWHIQNIIDTIDFKLLGDM